MLLCISLTTGRAQVHHKIGTESGSTVVLGTVSMPRLTSQRPVGTVGDTSRTEGKAASSPRRLGATVGAQINCTNAAAPNSSY